MKKNSLLVGSISAFCLLFSTGCSEESYMKEPETIVISSAWEKSDQPEQTLSEKSPQEGSETKEETTVPAEEAGTAVENDRAVDETEAGQYYIYTADRNPYDYQALADLLLDPGYESDGGEYVNGESLSLYNEGKEIVVGEDGSIQYNTIFTACYDVGIPVNSIEPVFSYQKAHLADLMPEKAELMTGYDQMSQECDKAAEALGFSYEEREAYRMDLQLLKIFGYGGPAWRLENIHKGPGERSEVYWKDDEEACLFVYRLQATDGEVLENFYEESILIITCSEEYGICSIHCPARYDYSGKSEVEILSIEEAYPEFQLRAVNAGIDLTSIEIKDAQIVYSAYEELFTGSPLTAKLSPFWKITFTSMSTDAEFEENMDAGFFTYRGTDRSEWYLMVPASSGTGEE